MKISASNMVLEIVPYIREVLDGYESEDIFSVLCDRLIQNIGFFNNNIENSIGHISFFYFVEFLSTKKGSLSSDDILEEIEKYLNIIRDMNNWV